MTQDGQPGRIGKRISRIGYSLPLWMIPSQRARDSQGCSPFSLRNAFARLLPGSPSRCGALPPLPDLALICGSVEEFVTFLSIFFGSNIPSVANLSHA